MNKAQRIRAIDIVVQSLDGMDPIKATIVLREHSFNCWNFLQEDDPFKKETIANLIQDSSDEKLSELLDFLAENPSMNDSLETNPSNLINIFISHDSKFKEVALHFKQSLSFFGANAFVAHMDIEPSLEWRGEIKKNLSYSNALIVVLTDGLEQKPWCQQEIGWALARNIQIFPVNFMNEIVPIGFLNDYQYFKYPSKDIGQIVEEIVTKLLHASETKKAMRESLCISLRNSYSFNNSRRLWDLISNMAPFSASEKEALKLAVSENPQVSECDFRGTSLSTIINSIG